MRMNLSAWAIKNEPLVRYFFVILLIAGVFAFSDLGQRENPKFTFRAMIVKVVHFYQMKKLTYENLQNESLSAKI